MTAFQRVDHIAYAGHLICELRSSSSAEDEDALFDTAHASWRSKTSKSQERTVGVFLIDQSKLGSRLSPGAPDRTA